jgi:hypothetical protein
MKELGWDRKASCTFRSVCKGWREAHDSMVPSMKLSVPSIPRLPYRLETRFTGVNELDLSSFGGKIYSRILSGMAFLSGLRSLNLADNTMDHGWMGHGGTAWAPSLTGLTYLSMAKTNVSDYHLARLAPFLRSLTHLDLSECINITLLPKCYNPPLDFSLTAVTRLNLSSTAVDDEGMRTLAPFTDLAGLLLFDTIVTDRGVLSLAPLTAHLTHLALTGHQCSDPELLAVCSLTALTRLEMLDNFEGALGFSEEGMRALASLTGLVHLELENAASDEGLMAISSLTALSHLHLRNPCYGDEGMRALACLTALTSLDMGDAVTAAQIEIQGYDMLLSDQGARSLGSLVRLTHLGICGVEISEEGVRALSSLTALTCMDLTSSTVSDEMLRALAALTALTALHLGDTDVGDEGVKAIAALPALTLLHLHGTKVGDEGVKALAGLTALTKLHLDDTLVGDEGVQALAALTALTELRLDNTLVVDEGVKALAALTALTLLHLHGTEVGDEGVKALAALTALTELQLDHTAVGDEGVKALASFPALSHFTLPYLARYP